VDSPKYILIKRKMGRYNNRRDDKRKTEMFDAVCSECGKDCKVPFKPTTGKPIYCSECFEKHDKKDSRDRKPRRSYDNKSSDINTKLLKSIDSKLDYVIETLKYGESKY
jgi:CxxC-x17-CxxC domain-containing protein